MIIAMYINVSYIATSGCKCTIPWESWYIDKHSTKKNISSYMCRLQSLRHHWSQGGSIFVKYYVQICISVYCIYSKCVNACTCVV